MCVKSIAIVTVLSLSLLAGAAGNAYAEAGVETGPPVSILALDDQGHVMVETELEFIPDWTSMGMGDPLTLEYRGPVSLGMHEDSDVVCEGVDPEEVAALVNFEVMLRMPDATRSCSFPLHPSGNFYSAVFPDGGLVILRLPEGVEPAITKAGYQGNIYPLTPVSAEEVARFQLEGEPSGVDTSTWLLEHHVAYADNASLVAYADGKGQADALLKAVEVITLIEEAYREENEHYSPSLCQLYTGPGMIIGAIPRNPYDFDLNLCKTEFSVPRPAGAVRYFPEAIGDTAETQTTAGYWLAVLGDGPTGEPSKPLPDDVAMPLRAIHWFEVHPEE